MTTTSHFLDAAKHGVAWVLKHQRPDGSFGDVNDGIKCYFKNPYLLALVGKNREAQRLARWVSEHHFTQKGDFHAPDWKNEDPRLKPWRAYCNAWIVQGMHRLGRWDLSFRGAEFLLRYQAPSGGFCMVEGETRYVTMAVTGWCGLAVLATGNVESACRAGQAAVNLVRSQPDPDRFYYRTDTDGRLTTDVPPGSELEYYVDASRREQVYFQLGIILMFLCKLYSATRNPEYLEAAKEVFGFNERCADDVYRFAPSGKNGTGSALLYALTGNRNARAAAVQLGEYLVETQREDGAWVLPNAEIYAAMGNKENYHIQMETVVEYASWLTEIASLI